MSLAKPFHNIYREGSTSVEAFFRQVCKSPEATRCLASYELLKKDLRAAFEYIEPSEANMDTYSHRVFELLLRACTEVESLCKQVFDKNSVAIGSNPNILRLSDLEEPMKLSGYRIGCYGFGYPNFHPFEAFANRVRDQRSPDWYRAYNNVKHNRSASFEHASLRNAIQAIGAVYALLVAQYGPWFGRVLHGIVNGVPFANPPDMFGLEAGPTWAVDERYEFSSDLLRESTDPYQNHLLPEIQNRQAHP